jgi:hypothetical protein
MPRAYRAAGCGGRLAGAGAPGATLPTGAR